MAPEEHLLTEEEVAEMLSCTPSAVRKWRGEGKIAYVKLGALVRFKPEEVQAFIDRGLQAPVCAACAEETA